MTFVLGFLMVFPFSLEARALNRCSGLFSEAIAHAPDNWRTASNSVARYIDMVEDNPQFLPLFRFLPEMGIKEKNEQDFHEVEAGTISTHLFRAYDNRGILVKYEVLRDDSAAKPNLEPSAIDDPLKFIESIPDRISDSKIESRANIYFRPNNREGFVKDLMSPELTKSYRDFIQEQWSLFRETEKLEGNPNLRIHPSSSNMHISVGMTTQGRGHYNEVELMGKFFLFLKSDLKVNEAGERLP